MKYISKKTLFKMLIVILSFVFVFCITGCNFNVAGNVGENLDMTPRLIELSGTQNATSVIEKVKSAIVGIKSNFAQGYAVGSGVAIRDGGYILTNQHVISGSRGITIYFADKSAASATLVWQDSSVDLAVIKANVNMPYLAVETENLSVGEDVLAIGTPLSLAFGHTVTKGIISALNRTIEIENENGSVSYMQNLIQHDASINPGNSGGPLINLSGRVVGINTLKASNAEGIGFAIPIVTGEVIVNRLSADNGYTPPYMGLFGVASEYAVAKELLKVENGKRTNQGLFIMDVDENSISKLNGIMAGDIIYKIDDTQINDFLDLRRFIYSKNSGDRVVVNIIRANKDIKIEMIL